MLCHDKIDKILSLVDDFLSRANVPSISAGGPAEVFIVQGINIDGAFLGNPHGKVCRTISMHVESGEIEQHRLGWLAGVDVGVVVMLAFLVSPFAVGRVVLLVKRVITLFLLNFQHFLDPSWSVFFFNLLE